jgi:hypothetical protein
MKKIERNRIVRPLSVLALLFIAIFIQGCNGGQDVRDSVPVQAGFYTPSRTGQMWDTWVYFYKGVYYQYYLAGKGGKWDSFELMTSADGVNWRERGRMLEPRPGTTWMGTGHIIEAPGFDRKPRWIMNYSEWFGDQQDIMFATSDDLLHWTKVNDSMRFVQDPRWYLPKGRWDCIDCVRRSDGAFYGYFTADPVPGTPERPVCGFGFAQSTDGIRWSALPPVEGNITGELGGIQKIGNRYFLTVSEGRIASSDKPEGPFIAQKKNPNMFGQGCDIYFPRFFHNAPARETIGRNGVLVNHFYTGSDVIYSAPLKAVEIDGEGILRLKWWEKNNLLKGKKAGLSLDVSANTGGPVRLFAEPFDTGLVGVVEADLAIGSDEHEKSPAGFYYEINRDSGYVILFNRRETVFGTMKRNGTGLTISVRVNRDLVFPEKSRVRLVFKKDLMEAYLNDYLVMLKRMSWSGRVGLVENAVNADHVRAWTHK